MKTYWLLFALISLTVTNLIAQATRTDYIVTVDGKTIQNIQIVEKGSLYMRYTYGDNPAKKSISTRKVSYFEMAGKRYDVNPLAENVQKPANSSTESTQATSLSPTGGPISNAIGVGDRLFLHNGEVISGEISAITERSISYVHSGEKATNSISRNAVQRVQFSSGREQVINEKIVIRGERDYEKVLITMDPNEVVGLVRKGEVRERGNNAWNFKSAKGVDAKTTRKIKREAAELGAHIVLLMDNETRGMTLFSPAKSFKMGIAYAYK